MTEDTVAIVATPSTVTDKSASLEQRKNVLVNELMEIFTIGEDITQDCLRTEVVDQFLRQYRHSKDDQNTLQGIRPVRRTSNGTCWSCRAGGDGKGG
ncbi:hypothetical protein ColKHC_07387 [Colletotrichum higginsianum]|nr:hypothetical protein ColKHC_07387 [Colletotrichum higginsianum]